MFDFRLNKYHKKSILFFVVTLLLIVAQQSVCAQNVQSASDTTRGIIYPVPVDDGNPYNQIGQQSPMYLQDPPNIKREIVYNPATGQYDFVSKVGDFTYRTPTMMDAKEYLDYQNKKGQQSYWNTRKKSTESTDGSIIPPLYIGGKAFDMIFGGNTIDIRPQGSAEVSFGVKHNKRDDPRLNVRQRSVTNFDFNQKIQMSVIAKIGEKIDFKINYNTEATFEFENKMKLQYTGNEDEIIKLIEAGNVSFPLNSTLITGSQALFGVKTQLQFGRTTVTALFSEQESESKNITVQGGAQMNEFDLTTIDYEENRHFFLNQYFRSKYEEALETLPVVTSDINITKIEVWVTNKGAALENNRNILAFTDLGEAKNEWLFNNEIHPTFGSTLPSNKANDLMTRMDTTAIRSINTVSSYLTGDPFRIGKTGYLVSGQDFEKIENARKLNASEYTLNSKLGFISLNTSITSDQTIAVAYQYTVIGYNETFQVGEFSDQGISAPKVLSVKLLKSTTLNTRMPMWNLMMKNVYSIKAYQVNRDDFTFNILYSGNENGVPTGYFMEGNENVKGIPLIHLLNLDNLNQQNNPIRGGDGVFDFIDNAASSGGTINSSNGRIYFTVLEPFGSHIRNKVFKDNVDLANKYAFDSLYTMTKTAAEQYTDKNKFILEGYYKSQSGSEISLNALNVPQGSVKVTAGGVPLSENVDYTVDYTLGRVSIINEGILNSGTPINISLESNSMFSLQKKRMMGLRVEHILNENFRIGGTLLNLRERPLTQKVNYGDDPINNTIYGIDLSYQTESRWLTKMVDKLPGIKTKQISKINFSGEFAHFLPGHSRSIGTAGTSYIDDFEGAKSSIDLRQFHAWYMASTPQGQTDRFPEAAPGTGLDYGKNRAKLAWYIIDPLFYDRYGTLRPGNVDKNELSKHSSRQILEQELFPNKQVQSGISTNISVLNLAYFPTERGPYNYDVQPTSYSAGMDEEGNLRNPETRWGGIMRPIESTDFEATNIEYLEFWMMDPFIDDPNKSNQGELYFNLGDISEDILRDGRKSYENGLPSTAEVINVDTTIWGRVPTLQAIVEAFNNDPASRKYQDIGYDGLSDDDEASFFKTTFLDAIQDIYGINSRAYELAMNDPSADNFHYFRGSDYDSDSRYGSIVERYKNFNGPEGNSPTDEQNSESYSTSSTTLPNVEDINKDNTLSESERYFQYEIKIDPNKMNIGENFIADIHTTNVTLANGQREEVTWYQFRVPINQPSKVIGNIEDFRSIRFMRMFLRGFEQPLVLRFATLELIRGEWRTYTHNIQAPGEYIPSDASNDTKFNISAVNYEENGNRTPIPYRIPPGIDQEINYGTTSLIRLNEQSMMLTVQNLLDGDARAAYKTTGFDFRQYKKLKMYVHAEKFAETDFLEDGDVSIFIRMGSDFTENYYEYEIPLTLTPWHTSDQDLIWPESNRFEIDLDKLVEVKQRRNKALQEPNTTVRVNYLYTEQFGDNQIKVIGNPSVSEVKGMMIGIRNPKRNGVHSTDDGSAKNVIVWVNELRLTDFNNSGGWAATGRVEAMLADLGRVTFSGSHSSSGFGSLDMKVNEVSLESTTSFDVATDIDLGKFLPEQSGVKIPMHFDYGETHINPKYNPLNPDVTMKDELDALSSKSQRDSLKKLVNDYSQRKNINFINVRKERTGRNSKIRIYDIENFNASYSYSEAYNRNIDIDYNIRKIYRGGLAYNYISNPKNVQPFAKWKLFRSPILQLLKDFNFYYMPKNLSFRTEMNRQYDQKKLRTKSGGDVITYPTYSKEWTWTRDYTLQYDITRGLKLDFAAGANAYIYEPDGNPERNSAEWKSNRDTIIDEILSFGTKTRYTQTLKLNYAVPINKIPLFNWVTLNAIYQGGYTWLASARSVQDRLGNSIENENTKQLNGNLDLGRLYSKIPYLKTLNTPSRTNTRGTPPRQGTTRPREEAPKDSIQEKPKVNYFKIAGDQLLKLAMSVKRASINYTQKNGQYLPGFVHEPDLFGLNFANGSPGFGFVFGGEEDVRYKAISGNWLTLDSLLNSPYSKKYTETFNYRINIEPVPGMKIDINGDRSYAENFAEYFRADANGVIQTYTPTRSGSFSMSYGMWKTSFVNSRKDEGSRLFDDLLSNRKIIAERLAQENAQWVAEGSRYFYDTVAGGYYPYGYGSTSQEVVMYAFLAAYRGGDASKITMNPFPKIPIPNWSINYTGLTNIPIIQKWFKTVSITHAYRSSYTINTFASNVNYNANNTTQTYENSSIFIPKYDIGQMMLTEQYAPLIGVDLGFHNSLTAKFEYKKSRSLTLSFTNNQLTEINGHEIVIGSGYRIRNLSIFASGSRSRASNDLVLKVDLGFRNDKTTLRRIDENNNQVSAGQQKINLYITADYTFSTRLTGQVFFKRDVSDPFVSSQFKTTSTFAGFLLRFNLAQ